ncbi:MAG: hypothetical protein JWO06_827 [Bacteroidota bacterium]|nr:hypothetical protein [Bacteroidota bacterium]
MRNTITTVLLIVFIGAAGFLWYQNMNQKRQIEALTKHQEELSKMPAVQPTMPANPAGASPFDKPNIDPLANTFTPTSAGEGGITSIKFERLKHDFGRINEGEIVKTKFKFTNTGETALLITNAHGSCGCTVPDWPRSLIKPNESADIDVQFDSHGKSGEVEKTVTVSANTNPATTLLTIKSTVVPRNK